ncbi:MAG: hypothetical protein IPH20_18125 [Bacteroidales bacterium]|nr:hypothetical protein [Bacteroidales bacterium]
MRRLFFAFGEYLPGFPVRGFGFQSLIFGKPGRSYQRQTNPGRDAYFGLSPGIPTLHPAR